MKSKKRLDWMRIFIIVFLAIFALPFLGGYLMMEEDTEIRVMGGILCVVGLVIWFMFGLH